MGTGTARIAAAAFATLALASTAAVADDFESLRLERVQRQDVEAPRPRPHAPRRVVVPRHAYAAPVVAVPAATWSVPAGADLQGILSSWAAKEGWHVLWQSDMAYEMTAGATFGGDFEDAVKALILAMHDVRPAPTVNLYRGNKTVVVSNMGATSTD